MTSKPLTISDIARLSGVSKKSVSRVLNDEQGVSDTTRERVRRIMDEQGYQPDRRARALAANRSFLLALAYNNPNSSYVLELLKGVLDAANAAGYEVIMHPLAFPESASAGDELLGFMRRAGCDGVILTPPLSESTSVLARLTAAGIAVARIAGDDLDAGMPQACFDDRAAALLVTNHLARLGHRRIAFIGGPSDSGPTRRRFAGFRDALRTNGLGVDDQLVRYGSFTFISGMVEGRALLEQSDRPTAIMCCNDEMAAGVINAANQLGLRVPQDLSVSGFDDAPIASEVWPPLTTVRQPLFEMGKTCTAMLLSRLAGDSGAAQVMFEHDVVSRASTAAVPD